MLPSASEKHLCPVCYSGDLTLRGELNFHMNVIGLEKPLEITVLGDIADSEKSKFYFSVYANPTYGWGKCPNVVKCCVVEVKDKSGNAVSGAVINGDSSLITNKRGLAYVPVASESQIITALKDGVTGSALYTSPASRVKIKLGVNASEVKAKAVELSDFHQAVVTEDKSFYTWGSNSSGQVGNGSKTYADTPAPVKGLEDEIISDVRLYEKTVWPSQRMENSISGAITVMAN